MTQNFAEGDVCNQETHRQYLFLIDLYVCMNNNPFSKPAHRRRHVIQLILALPLRFHYDKQQ